MHDHDLPDAREWDERYARTADGAPIWSGHPNGTLVAEVADLTPGTALDVGCGEGADAIWLARQGWTVTAIDPSQVALDRAAAAADEAGVDVTWVRAGLLEVPGGTGVHDLVSAQYAVLRRSDDGAAIGALLDAVAPSGTLLVVHHDLDADTVAEHAAAQAAGHDGDHDGHIDDGDHGGFDPTAYVLPADVAAALDDGWEVQVDEVRPRPGPLPAEARHVRDVVLRARRLR